jgi:primosomal protein N' (replication factor Y)
MSRYYQVAVNFPKNESILTYKSNQDLYIGDLVDVPLGKRKSQGVVLGVTPPEKLDELNTDIVKLIDGKIANSYSLDDKEIGLYQWMHKYYHYSLGKLIFDCLPKILKRPRKPDFELGAGKAIPHALTPDQSIAYEGIHKSLTQGFSQHYVHGVTGSGKSLIYLKLIKDVIDSGRSAQFLLPEINLTPQFVQMFQEHLGCKVYSYHSGVTPSQKYNIWKELKEESEPVLVMGVRSSIFLPIKELGVIIVDEEHDQSFKQSDRCPYNGRDVAIKKAQLHSCPVVLGSATPTMENYQQFSNEVAGRHYYQLKKRVGKGHFPKLELKDARDRFTEDDPTWPLLPETLSDIRERLEAGEQVLIFINKLGYSNYLQCRSCGHQFINEKCGCANNLRFFKAKRQLSCAHCDFKMPAPDSCPECGSLTLMNRGFGTEKVEAVMQQEFPNFNVERFDRDEITTVKQLTDKLERFHNKEIDVFVGTQMLAKGHNFERVNLVVMLGMDAMLNYADFRSSERTYQLAQQVAGRAGRYAEDSKVIIQTMNPEHSIFKFIQEHSFDGFYQDEVGLREICHCPPFSKIVMVYFSSRFRDRLIPTIGEVTRQLQQVIAQNFQDVRLLGPTPMAIEKKANQYTWAFMLKSSDINQLHNVIQTFEANYKTVSSVSYKIDVDPMQVL